MKLFIPTIFLILILIIINGCNAETQQDEFIGKGTPVIQGTINMKLTSPAFEHNQAIPSEYTCDGSDTQPELNIENVPNNAKSLALIMDDPDAPGKTWVHWVVWNIPLDNPIISKGVQGTTDFGRTGYGGPCPPSGTHRYFFKLYALNSELDLPEGATKKDIEAAMQDHIIEKTELIGTYKKQ